MFKIVILLILAIQTLMYSSGVSQFGSQDEVDLLNAVGHGSFNIPSGIAVSENGNILVSDSRKSIIQKFSQEFT